MLAIVKQLSRAMRDNSRRPPARFGQLARLWSAPSLAQAFRTRRPWYSGHPPSTSSNAAELDNLEAFRQLIRIVIPMAMKIMRILIMLFEVFSLECIDLETRENLWLKRHLYICICLMLTLG